MTDPTVYVEKKGSIAHLVLNRLHKRNALTWEMWRQLGPCAETLEDDLEVKVVIVRGEDDTAFAAGADIDEFGTVYASPESGKDYSDTMLASEQKLFSLSKPTIAQIQGPCMGAGCAIALCCDIRIADKSAKFAVPPARLGLVYSLFDTKRLVDAVGPSMAKQMIYTSATLSADEALSAGLITQLVDAEGFADEVASYAQKIASLSRYTTLAAKRIVGMIIEGATDETDETRRLFNEAFQGEDFQEGRAAFLEKRKPSFTFKG